MFLLSLFALGTAPAQVPAPTPQGTFTQTSDMNLPRERHTATLLNNGKVLVAGGNIDTVPNPTETAELFDPASETFIQLPPLPQSSMSSKRSDHTATLVVTAIATDNTPEKQAVLIAGGVTDNAGSVTNTAELFDPITQSFTAVSDMTFARAGHTATLVTTADGKKKVVLIAGGVTDGNGSVTNTAELFDPTASPPNFIPLPPMNSARSGHTATLLPDGTVLIAGGDMGSGPAGTGKGPQYFHRPTANTERFDPITKVFTALPPMNIPRAGHTATLVTTADGRQQVLIAGGITNVGGALVVTNTAELFDPASGTFTLVLPPNCQPIIIGSCTMTSPRSAHTATVLPNQTVLIAGGDIGGGEPTKTAETFDPILGRFTPIFPNPPSEPNTMNEPRYFHRPTLVVTTADGRQKVLITGGITNVGGALQVTNTAELFNPAGGTLSTSRRTVAYTQPGPLVQNNSGAPGSAPDCSSANSCSTFDLTIDPSVGTAANGYDPSQYQIYMKWGWALNASPSTPDGTFTVPTDYDIYVVNAAKEVVKVDRSTANPRSFVLPTDPTKTPPGDYKLIVVLRNGPPTDSAGAPIFYTGTIDLDPIGFPLVSGNGGDLLNWPACDARGLDTWAENFEWSPSLAVNPDPKKNNLVAAWMQGHSDGIAVGYSTDGGSTWNQSVPATNSCTGGTQYSSAESTEVSFGGDGTAYLASMVNGSPFVDPTGLTPLAGSAIIVNRSSDGGHTWPSPPTEVWVSSQGGSPCDADPRDGLCDEVNFPSVVADPDPSRSGVAYVSWGGLKTLSTVQISGSISQLSGNIFTSNTADGGVTWSTPSKIPSDSAQPDLLQLTGQLVILPDGTLVSVFIEIPPVNPTVMIDPNDPSKLIPEFIPLGPTKLMAARSTNGGVTWSDPITIADPADPSQNHIVFAGVAVAPDLASPSLSTIYVAWPRADSSGSSFSLMYSKSTDGGRTWVDAARIGEPVRGSMTPGPAIALYAAAPSLAVAPDGTLGVTFFDHRNASASNFCGSNCLATDYWFRHLQNGGQTWQEEHLSGPFHGFKYYGSGTYSGSIAPLPDGFATTFVLSPKFAGSPGQHISHGPTDVFYSKVSVDAPLTGVVSRKVHGDAGTFDIDLPFTGTPGIECRSGGASHDYTLVFTFASPLASVGGVNVTGGTAPFATVANSAIDSSDPRQYIVNLTGVTNAQTITVTLTNVTDTAGKLSTAVSASMGVLLGDVNASGRVDAADVSLVRQQTLQPVTTFNFREDINTSGRIDAADVSIARQQTLTSLP